MLSAAQISQCNASPVLQQPSIRVTPPPVITQLPARSGGPVTIAAPELWFVGGATVDTSDRAAPAVTVTAPELSFIGGAMVDTADRSAPAVVVNTPELLFVGR
jgi:hypothetical protein